MTMVFEIKRVDIPSPVCSDEFSHPPREADAILEYPLSYGQKALWFHQCLDPSSAAHNVVHAANIRAELDVDEFRRAFSTLVERHPSLRTTFGTQHDHPVQRVYARGELLFSHLSVMGWSPEKLRSFISTEIYRPFDLARGPLMRVFLLTRERDDHVVLLALHHIVTDMWSIALLMDEVTLIYGAARSGKTLPPAPGGNAYADHVHEEAAMLDGEEGAQQWSFWQKQLEGELPVLNLYTDFPRPSKQTHRGGRQFLRLTSDLAGRMKALGVAHKTNLFTAMLAAFFTLLQRYTGQTDLIIGTPRANRRRKTAATMGYFINPVVLRVDLSGDPTFSQVLDRVRQVVNGAFEHGAYPFPLLVERLQPVRDLSRSPIVQIMFSWQKTTSKVDSRSMTSFALGEGGERIELNGLPMASVSLDEQAVPFDLTMLVAEASGRGLGATIEYNVDLFDQKTVGAMLVNYRTLLHGIVDAPDVPISRLPLLANEDRGTIQEDSRALRMSVAELPPVHDSVAAQVVRTPAAIAVQCRDVQLTYAELDHRAALLARYLRHCDVRNESLVGVCIDRSIDALIAVLGVLKSGGAYLPLDPEYPADRLRFMLEDSQVGVVLTHAHLIDRLPAGKRKIIALDRDWEEVSREQYPVREFAPLPENIAYVIYTSGSTGTPKGVQISHGAFAAHCAAMKEYYHLTAQDHVLQFASLSFDASLEQIFPALMAGATLVLRDPEMYDPVHFIQSIGVHKLSVINLPPAFWHQVAQSWSDAPGRGRGDSLRLVIIGGDVLRSETVQLWGKTPAGQARLLNAYGPTETTITSLIHELQAHQGGGNGSRKIPIGKPLAGRSVYILDRQLNAVPAGAPGELYIGGQELARGYLHRPAITAEHFLPDPFSLEPGARLYRTGDLVRLNHEGNIEFVGRVDHQVKIRGFRVELQEIESVLGQYPGVAEAVVLAKDGAGGDKRLVAYVVPVTGSNPAVSDLRRFLRAKLPGYMIPASFVTLAALPLTPGGKVNLQILPEPAVDRNAIPGAYVAPQTAIEKAVVEIWEEVVGVRRVSIEDNFFELGGHSLLATQIVSRVRDRFHVDIPLETIFDSPTAASMANLVDRALIEYAGDAELQRLIREVEVLEGDSLRHILQEEQSLNLANHTTNPP